MIFNGRDSSAFLKFFFSQSAGFTGCLLLNCPAGLELVGLWVKKSGACVLRIITLAPASLKQQRRQAKTLFLEMSSATFAA